MKKMSAIVMLLSAMVTLFAAETGKSGVELKLNNHFVANGNGGVAGWVANTGEEFKPFGTATAVLNNGVPGIRLVSKGKYTAIFTGEQFAAKTGDIFKFTCKVSGKGRYALGIYMYGFKEQWEWRGSAEKVLMADSAKPVEVTAEVEVKASEVRNVALSLIAFDGADVTFSEIKCTRLLK